MRCVTVTCECGAEARGTEGAFDNSISCSSQRRLGAMLGALGARE